MNEKQIQQHVIDRWRKLGKPGTLVAAIPNARSFGQPGLTKGLPDLICIGPHIGVAFLELKTERGKLSTHQEAFLDLCSGAGVLATVSFGLDDAVRVIEAWDIVRGPANPIGPGFNAVFTGVCPGKERV